MKRKSGLFYALLIALMICLPATTGICEMHSLSDVEMQDIYAEGFSEFTLNNLGGGDYEMNLWLNINTAQYTTIDTLKLGYHDNGSGIGWDHDWSNVSIGTGVAPENNFYTEGFFFKAEFANFEDPNSRRLKSVSYGVDVARGDIHADFDSFTGDIGGDLHYRTDLGTGTISSDGRFALSLSIEAPYYIGYWMAFDNATFTAGP